MATKKPLVVYSGYVKEIADGDSLSTVGAPATIPVYKNDGSRDDILLDSSGAVTAISGATNIDTTTNGTYTIAGGAGWRDITSDINVKGTGANNPAWTTFINGISTYAFSATVMQECWLVFHVDHDYKPGTGIYLHTHWSTTGTNTGVCRWGFEYTIAKGHNQSNYGATTTVYAEQAYQGTAYRHMVTETAEITSAELEVDCLILVRVFRDAAHVNDTLTSVAHLFTSDIHYQADRFATKNKAPNFYT